MAITCIYNVKLPHQSSYDGFVIIEDERIVAIGNGHLPCVPKAWHMVDGDFNLLMPGVIDCHVHFREPGLTHKADIASESRAAVAGGVTSYIDMPNTVPQTTTQEAWREKCKIAAQKSLANYAFFVGATNNNLDELKALDYTQVPGVKLFMGSSTGNMLVDKKQAIEKLFSELPPEVPIAIHAEDQAIVTENAKEAQQRCKGKEVPIEMHTWIRSAMACLKATKTALKLAEKYPRHIHICHLSTNAELDTIIEHNEDNRVKVTCEVSPHHLLWNKDDYATKGARIKMNPSVKTQRDSNNLLLGAQMGEIDMIATDHAPHLLSEKEGDALTAVSGAPILQFSLPLMLTLFDDSDVVSQLMCEGPARVYGIVDRGKIEVGYYADLVLVKELDEPKEITDADCLGKCGWSPAAGEKVEYEVESTWVNGQLVYDNGTVMDVHAAMPLEFDHELPIAEDDDFDEDDDDFNDDFIDDLDYELEDDFDDGFDDDLDFDRDED